MTKEWNHETFMAADAQARALRAAYVRQFFANLFRRRTDRDVAIGNHAAAH